MKKGFQKVTLYNKISCPICLDRGKNHVINHYALKYLCFNCYEFLEKNGYLDENTGGGFVELTFDKYNKYMLSLIFVKTIEL